MKKNRKKNNDYEDIEENSYDNDLDYNSDDDIEFDDDDRYEPDYGDELEDDFDDLPDKSEKPNKKEYYVKGSDLIAEIKKYQDSKKNDPEGRRNGIRRTPGS